jgi:hypothetical protein
MIDPSISTSFLLINCGWAACNVLYGLFAVAHHTAPFAANAVRCSGADGPAMSEHGRVEAERCDLALAGAPFLDVLEAERIARAEDAYTDVTSHQHSLALTQECELSRAVARHMDDLQSAS